MSVRIRKDDTVMVMTGKAKGKTGKVLQVFPDEARVLVERINLVKHFVRRTKADQPGGVLEREGPIALANVLVVCPRCHRPTRVGRRINPDGTKQRLCKKCHEPIG